MTPELEKALKAARERYNSMSPQQKAKHDYAQRRSFVRGMCSSTMDFDKWCELVDRLLPPMNSA